MSSLSPEEQAYVIGQELARRDFEKQAFLGGALSAGKFLFGMGNLGAKGSRLAGLSAHHVGMPLGFGAMSAMSAEEGEKGEGFLKGLAGGLMFNAAMPVGGWLGKKLLAPGFGGKGTQGIMRGMGFGDDAAAQMAASQGLNKPLHGSLTRRLGAGTAKPKHLENLQKAWKEQNKGLTGLSEDLVAQQTSIGKLLGSGTPLTTTQQGELAKQLSAFTKSLYQGGYQTGSRGARAMLKGTRFAKGLGTMAGGMGLGMYGTHAVENAMTTHPASVFDARGGH